MANSPTSGATESHEAISKGTASNDTGAEGAMSNEAWAAFCDRMKALGEEIQSADYPGHPRARAEGYRHLARMVMLGLEWRVQWHDPDYPMFMSFDDDVVSWGGPNVDNTYLRARIDGESTYRIDGNVAGLHNIIVSTYRNDMHEGDYFVGGDLHLDDLEVDAQGNFELIVSPEPHPGNWLRTQPGIDSVMIRTYHYDWRAHRPGRFHIVKAGNEGNAPGPLTTGDVSRGLERAGDWIESNIRYWNRYIQDRAAETPVNNLSPPKHVPGGSTNIVYGFGVFELAPDEAMLIESRVPDAGYWGLQYYTMGWYESPDYANRVTSLNGAQSFVNADGRVRWVVAHRDPGVQNWIDTEQRRRGFLTYRWIWTQDQPAPTTRVVKFADLPELLPQDTPAFSPQQRREQIRTRRRHVEARFHQ